jgi:hypothetical protein
MSKNAYPKFSIMVEQQDQKPLRINLSGDQLKTIIDNLNDNPLYDKLIEAAAQHPSAGVRASIAFRDRLTPEAIETLLQENNPTINQNLVKSDSFRAFADHQLIMEWIQKDAEIAETVARAFQTFVKVQTKKLIKVLEKHPDPRVLYALAANYATPKSVKERLAKNDDPDVAFEAKSGMK